MNSNQKRKVYDAMQSNFRVLSLLTDPNGITQKVMELNKHFPVGSPQREEFNNIIYKLTDMLSQTTYTGRCLGGVLYPRASVHTDQRPMFRVVPKDND
jgi:hypothetical protein